MRVFIAIELPKEIKDYLFEICKELFPFASIRQVSKKVMHLTMRFFGEISENKMEEIKEMLKEVKFKKIKVNLDSLGVYPNEGYARVLWVDLKPAGKVIELKDDIDKVLLELFKKEERFSVHITLGRVKQVKDREGFIKKLKEIKIEKKEFEINEFKLMKSELTKDGPVYMDLGIYNAGS